MGPPGVLRTMPVSPWPGRWRWPGCALVLGAGQAWLSTCLVRLVGSPLVNVFTMSVDKLLFWGVSDGVSERFLLWSDLRLCGPRP